MDNDAPAHCRESRYILHCNVMKGQDGMEKEREIIKLIAAELTRRKMSKTELAAALGYNRRTVYYWFEGKRKLSIDTADTVLRLLGIEIQLGEKRLE